MLAGDIAAQMEEAAKVDRNANHPPILLSQDAIMLRLCAAWPLVDVGALPRPDLACPLPETASLRLLRLWYFSQIVPDVLVEWIEQSGLPDAPHVRRAARTAIGAGYVLASGDLHVPVDQYVEQVALDLTPTEDDD